VQPLHYKARFSLSRNTISIGILHIQKGIELMLKLAYCGNDCNYCPRYVATQSGDKGRLQELAAVWKKLGWRDDILRPEEMVCYGCSSVHWCRYGVRECALEKRIDNCAECENYPCEKITKTFNQTRLYARKSKGILSRKEYQRFQKAYK
jgi:hypothetical protein